MFYATIIIYALLIFPLSFSVYFNVDFNAKGIYFGGYIFDFIKIIKGKIFFNKNRIIYLINKKKNNLMLKDLISVKTKIEPFYDFNIYNVKLKFLLTNRNIKTGITVFILNYIYNFLFFTTKNFKPYIDVKNEYEITNEKKDNIFLSIKIRFNIIVVIISFIKIIVGKMYEKRKKQ